jgi:putative SOS response-associated peptidase YedK
MPPAEALAGTVSKQRGPINAERMRRVRMRWGLVPQWWSKPLKELRMATAAPIIRIEASVAVW